MVLLKTFLAHVLFPLVILETACTYKKLLWPTNLCPHYVYGMAYVAFLWFSLIKIRLFFYEILFKRFSNKIVKARLKYVKK